MHHGDLEEIHRVGCTIQTQLRAVTFGQAGGANDTLSLLNRGRPRIVVDESGG